MKTAAKILFIQLLAIFIVACAHPHGGKKHGHHGVKEANITEKVQ